ncbi:unnamed protein product [Spirodela intermedia]|uniref:RRM domain-containing protein n=1 Tax=Spirodela intermedia TaxID=51605 RepID=A0A7I8JKS6_SPIIN|nr:unnamed protein product [Spirodela intermedia]CAA6670754.1 unnamed protein product [Spirodela intermedia]
MGRAGGGRERYRSEYTPRVEDKGGGGVSRSHQPGRAETQPSRHLWSMLLEQFLRFGDLENIAFIPGRSYGFVNFKKEEDAVFALRTLQGHMFAGVPLKIEFQKGLDKFPASSLDGEYGRDERSSTERGESFHQRDSRQQIRSPGKTYPDKPQWSNNEEPSELLRIERAFSPFGELDKVMTFPGRSYAFVRYRSIVAACLAKEALQGRLFNNPRVSISFAKNDTGPPELGRGLSSNELSIHGRPSPPVDTGRRQKDFDASVGEFPPLSSRFLLEMENTPGDREAMGFGRTTSLGMNRGLGTTAGSFEHPRYQSLGSERRVSEDRVEYLISPTVEKAPLVHELIERPQKASLSDPWDIDESAFSSAKKIKIDPFPDRELPEYPFSDFEKESQYGESRKIFPRLPESHIYNRSLVSDFGGKDAPDYTESNDSWRKSDGFTGGSTSLHIKPKPDKWHRFNPEPQKFALNDWKWEGTIAKGGTPICRARCFPVGKALDFMLPEFLDCTARTGLDMLARHFYQASGSWVVFFVPETDADIVFYNEFMNFLGEKNRAAVAKLEEKTTLFLVPPSDFSEKVLKVPGKLSISGVVLRFQQPSSDFDSVHYPPERVGSTMPPMPRSVDETTLQGNRVLPKTSSPNACPSSKETNYFSSLPEHFAPTASSESQRPTSYLSYSGSSGRVHDRHGERMYDRIQKQNPRAPSTLSPSRARTANSGFGNPSGMAPMASHSPDNSMEETFSLNEQNMMPPRRSSGVMARASSIATPTKPPPPSTGSIPSVLPEHLAQLASFLGQQKHLGKDPPYSLSGDQMQQTSMQKPTVHNRDPAPSNPAVSLSSQMQQLQRHAFSVSPSSETGKLEQLSNQLARSSAQEESETDPQKRLQATLQLAAALLQQIQQQSKPDS